MTYDFKKVQELLWSVGVAAAIAVVDIVRVQSFEAVTDWGSFAMILVGGGARAGAGAFVAFLSKTFFTRGA